jgi:tRNA modification GTPase
VARLDEQVAQLMPHGGPRVVQRLLAWLVAAGVPRADASAVDAASIYPEAGSRVEALMLRALASAASPLAIDLLLDQPRRWREATPTQDDAARSRRLARLLVPPTVVVAGPANVGKSTLANTLAGRNVSITLDAPGTTRDYTAVPLDLAGLAVTWIDTPGLRATDDVIEGRAVDLARAVIEQADLLIALTDAAHDWPPLPRPPDLLVGSRCDLGARDDAALHVSGTTGAGLADLVAAAREWLVPDADLAHPGPWIFDAALLDGS